MRKPPKRPPLKSELVLKFFHLPNKDLAKLLYGEVNEKTLWRVRSLKRYVKKNMEFYETSTKAYKPVKFFKISHLSFKDLKHYETTSPFIHDNFNDLNLRYLADVARFVNSRTLRDPRFEAKLFEYLRHYLEYFERNEKGNVRLYVDTNKGTLRGHHKNKALLYYIIIMIYCRFYRCPNEDTRQALKGIIFTELEDADDILNFYKNLALEILAKEIL